MHTAPRADKAHDDCNMYASTPTDGTIAGCVQSNCLAQVLLWNILQNLWDSANSPSRTYLRCFVDDIRPSEYGTSEKVKETIASRAKTLAIDLIGIGCIISQKSTILASNKEIREHTTQELGHNQPMGKKPWGQMCPL